MRIVSFQHTEKERESEKERKDRRTDEKPEHLIHFIRFWLKTENSQRYKIAYAILKHLVSDGNADDHVIYTWYPKNERRASIADFGIGQQWKSTKNRTTNLITIIVLFHRTMAQWQYSHIDNKKEMFSQHANVIADHCIRIQYNPFRFDWNKHSLHFGEYNWNAMTLKAFHFWKRTTCIKRYHCEYSIKWNGR